jgi:hypothetical protein
LLDHLARGVLVVIGPESGGLDQVAQALA